MENFINNAPFIVVLLCLIVGFVFLVKGADLFVEGSSSVAKRFKVPSLIIGLTIVAMGTSLPETAVSVAAPRTQVYHSPVWFYASSRSHLPYI